MGLAATAMVAAGHLFGLADRAELMALDFRFRHFSRTEASDDVVVVAIDDRSLKELERWPWPRQRLAGLVEVLEQAGARAVGLDIILPEPQPTRFVSELWDPRIPQAAETLKQYPPLPVFDDLILAETLARHGNIAVPMHIDPNARGLTAAELAIRRVLTTRPAVPADRLRDELGASAADEKSFSRDYLAARSLAALARFGIEPDRVGDYPVRRGTIVPPLFLFAEGTRGTGFVTFVPDRDGTMRRIPLLTQADRKVYPQFAVALAAELLGWRRKGLEQIAADRSGVSLRFGDGTRRDVPVDAGGNMLINWAERFSTAGLPHHVSAFSVGAIWRDRQDLEATDLWELLCHADLVKLAYQIQPDDEELNDLCFERLPRAVTTWNASRRQRVERRFQQYRAVLFEPDPAKLARLGKEVAAAGDAEQEARKQLRSLCQGTLRELPRWMAAAAPSDPSRQEMEALRKMVAERIPADRRALRERIEEATAQLRRSVAGRLVLVGSTATGAADFVPTPLEPRMPGVMVHANIINTVASGAFVTGAPWAVNLAAILLAGGLVAAMGARMSILRAGPLALLLAAAYGAANLWIAFAVAGCWLVLVSPIAAMISSFLGVTAYRQFTEEREKRRIRSQFAHALTPALVDLLLADPSQLQPRRRTLSCFFSDLTSFTPLAERLGEQETIALLRRYFDRMTDVIQHRYGGYLNKFLGDGILGFFGAPVPLEDHAVRALAAAAACLEEVARLNRDLARELGDRVSLSCRVGISSGPVMFGDCGSTDRPDYSAIGDYVNLASRLETANKQFGTRILVDEQAWRQGDDGSLLARPLGKLLVVGKAEPIRAWNVVGPMAQATPQMRGAAADFAQAVELFAERRFAQAAELFEAIPAHLPGDKASGFFLALCRQYEAAPPPEGWDGAVRLTEK